MREQLIETIRAPKAYPKAMIAAALKIALAIDRGKFVFAVPPPHSCFEALDDDGTCTLCRRRCDD